MNIEIETMHHTHEAIKLKLHMRKLWTDHAIFTRMFIVDLISDLPSMDYTIGRLEKSQEQTGNCFRPFFGDIAANNLTSLLKEHTTISVDLFRMIKAGNITDTATLEEQLVINSENTSNLLCTMNQYYSIDDLIDIFRTYLILTKYQLIARIDGDYNADIMYFDMGLNHLLRISDYLADGIIEGFFNEQYPGINYEADTQSDINIQEIQEENIFDNDIPDNGETSDI